MINRGLNQVAPVLAGSVAISTIWGGFALYSGVTVVIVGGDFGRSWLQNKHPFLLYAVLPVLPISLVGFRLRHALHLRRGRDRRARAATAPDGAGAGAGANNNNNNGGGGGEGAGADGNGGDAAAAAADDGLPEEEDELFRVEAGRGPLSLSRLVVGGLATPYIGGIVSNVCLQLFPKSWGGLHPFDRACMGCAIYVGVKSVSKWYYRKKFNSLLEQRRILNFSAL